MTLTVTEDNRAQLDPVIADLAAVQDWSVFWHPIDQPYGREYGNRIAAHTGWKPNYPIEILSSKELSSVEFKLPGGRYADADPTGVDGPFSTSLWNCQLDRDQATEELVNEGRERARAALDEAVAQVSTRLGQPTVGPVWVTPETAPDVVMMSYPGFVVGWQRVNGFIKLDVWEDAEWPDEPLYWTLHYHVLPDLGDLR